MFHCLVILVHVLASQFIVHCCCMSLPELILWCYCRFYWCQECGILVFIQSQKHCVSFDQWYYLQPLWTTLLQFYVRCNSIGETCRFFHYKLLFRELFTYAGVFFGKSLHHFKIKESSNTDNLHFWFDKKLVSCPESLANDLTSFLPYQQI